GFQDLLKSQLAAIEQVMAFNQTLSRKLQNNENRDRWARSKDDNMETPNRKAAFRTFNAEEQRSPLTQPLLNQNFTAPVPQKASDSPYSSPSLPNFHAPDSTGRSPLSGISRESLRHHALQFGSRCRRAATRLAIEGSGSTPISRTYHRPVLAKPKDVKDLAKGVVDSINRQAQDPEKLYSESGRWQAIARSTCFKSLTLIMVFVSTAWIAVDTDYNTENSKQAYLFVAMDNIICAYFFFEITVRWMAYSVRLTALSDVSFLFDLFLAVSMSLETWGGPIFTLVTGRQRQDSGHGITPALRGLRLIRITRAFRMSRLFRSVPELMILVQGMFQGVRSVLTTLVLLLLVTYTFAVAMTQLLQGKNIGEGKFDNVPTATNFLLMQTLCGFDANYITGMLHEDAVSFFILLTYQLLGSLTLMNMLTGVMVDVVGTTAQLEQEEQSLRTLKRDIADVVTLTDENQDRTVTAVEFTHMIQNPIAVKKLYEGGVNVLALVDYADFVFRDTAELSLEDFVETVLQFRGQSPATVKDVVDLRVMVTKEMARLDKAVASVSPAK
ncbi:unnamed protein product, partial [Effrenium voratum]